VRRRRNVLKSPIRKRKTPQKAGAARDVFSEAGAISVEGFSHSVAMDPDGDVELSDSHQFLVENWVPLLES
jgi:hypothetical protein